MNKKNEFKEEIEKLFYDVPMDAVMTNVHNRIIDFIENKITDKEVFTHSETDNEQFKFVIK